MSYLAVYNGDEGLISISPRNNNTVEEVQSHINELGIENAVVVNIDDLPQDLQWCKIENGSVVEDTTKMNSEKLEKLRSARDKKLTETDWVVVKAQETGTSVAADWQTYRQALRDITNTYTSLEDVVWPTQPE